MIRISLGSVGCIAGDSLIPLNRGGNGRSYAIKYISQMYAYSQADKLWNLDIPSQVRAFTGEHIRLHPIVTAMERGKQMTFLLTLEDGKYLRLTENHEVMTSKGFLPLRCLSIGDEVMVDTLKPIKGNKVSHKLRDIEINGGYHPFKTQGSVTVHRLVYEAYLNDISFHDYLDILWNDEEESSKFDFINPKTHCVHHIDGNHYNNSKENLRLMSKEDHHLLHALDKGFIHFNQGIPQFSKIASISHYGQEKVYDIICAPPHHNFVANGIVIHNSGKSANEVREMKLNLNGRKCYSNIKTNIPHQVDLTPEMIIKKELVGEKKGQAIYDFKLNVEFWKNLKEPINIILDEAHSIINSRRSMSKSNVIMTDWIALVRRVLGGTDAGYGELVFITQLPNRLDVIARDMATQVRYHVCHYMKSCNICGATWKESSEVAESRMMCPHCLSKELRKYNHVLEIWHFTSITDYQMWKTFSNKTYYKHYLVNDIEEYFQHYSTMQWDNMFSEMY